MYKGECPTALIDSCRLIKRGIHHPLITDLSDFDHATTDGDLLIRFSFM